MDSPKLASLTNHLATVEQLRTSASELDGLPVELERVLRLQGGLLTQAAGILLHLGQEVVAQAIVVFNRFFVGHEGGSFLLHGVKDLSAAALYLVAKLSATPQSPRSVLNVYEYLTSPGSPLLAKENHSPPARPDVHSYTLSEGAYMSQRLQLFNNESLVLRQLSYATRVVLPHPLALTYIQTLFPPGSSVDSQQKRRMAERTIALLNTALLSPQLLYLTHQPHELAVAAVYLAARETGSRVSNDEWWLVWDVSREALGFLVLALRSVPSWIQKDRTLMSRTMWTVAEVEAALRNHQSESQSA